MLKPIYALPLVIVIGAAIVFWRMHSEQQTVPRTESATDRSFSGVAVNPNTTPSLPEPEFQLTKQATLPASTEDLGWTETQTPPVGLGSYIPGLKDQRFLQLNRSKLESLQDGDVLTFWIPQEAESMEVSVVKRVVTSSGNTVINGILDGDENYPFVMTIGKTSTFATISTRYAVYSLRGDTNVAWIASSAALKQHFPQEEKDYVVPNNS
jgi:hypothetical protein